MAESGTHRGRGRGGRGRGQTRHKRPPPDYYEESGAVGGGGGGGGGYSKKRKIMDDVFRFLVPEYLVRAIIGKGGEHVRTIKEQAKEQGIDTKVSIYAQGANGVPLMEHSKDRVMSVQTSMDGLHLALQALTPLVQRERSKGQNSQKLELRLMVPAHCCSAIIGKGGSVIKRIKDETKSYIQVYTLPLPCSEEHVVRIQNFEEPDLIDTAVKVFESFADIKGKSPIIMYDPIFFEHGEHGDTGSYIDTDWYQAAIKAGTAQPTPFKAVKAAMQHHKYGAGSGAAAGGGYEDAYDYDAAGYDPHGYGYDYDQGYGYDAYDGYDYDYSEETYFAPPPRPRMPAPRSRERGYYPPRARRPSSRPLRSRGGRGPRSGMRPPAPSPYYTDDQAE